MDSKTRSNLHVAFLFIFFMVFFEKSKISNLTKSSLPIIFLLQFVLFMSYLGNLGQQESARFSPIFSSRGFKILTFTFKFLIRFELIL